MKHQHWCEIRGHWFDCDQDHGPDYIGTKEDSEQSRSVELRGDCSECAGFHWWKIPRWLGIFWRYWICSRMAMPYWRWRASRLRCGKCGKRVQDKEQILVRAILRSLDGYVCNACQTSLTPDCRSEDSDSRNKSQ